MKLPYETPSVETILFKYENNILSDTTGTGDDIPDDGND
jgi:hypothetical protein